MDTQTYKTKADLLSTEQVPGRLGVSDNAPSLRDEFALMATPSQDMLLAAQAGFSTTKFAYTSAAVQNNDEVKAEEERKKVNIQRQGMLNAFSTFDIGGIQMSMEQIISNIGKINNEYDVRIQRNYDAIRVTEDDMAIDPRTNKPFATPEERDAYMNGCGEGLTTSDVTMDDNGNLVSVGGLEWAQMTEEALTLEQLEVEFLQTGIEDGSIDPNSLSEDQKLMIANMEQYGTTTPGIDIGRALEMAPAEVIINAGMAPINSVTAEIKYQQNLEISAPAPAAPNFP